MSSRPMITTQNEWSNGTGSRPDLGGIRLNWFLIRFEET